jgi:DNA (cytosine-5)-methyltransferase 1
MSHSRRRQTMKAIDLFSGCGGLSLGLRQAGFSVVGAVDLDPLASSTYRMNHKSTEVVERDIATIDPYELMATLRLKPRQLALLAGCPPCQGFSTLRTLNGRKNIDEPMNDLIFHFTRFVRTFRPKTVMLENVPGLTRDPRLGSFTRSLAAMGYKYRFDVFDAADYGVPQRRRRLILLAALAERPQFARPARKRPTVRSVIEQMPSPGWGNDLAHDYPVDRSSHVLEMIKLVPKDGGSRSDLGNRAQLPCHRKCDGFKDVYGRMSWSAPAPTITGGCINPSKGRFLHPLEDRAITVREAALLQGFPRTYKLDLSRGRYPAAQMIGNAFPPEFAARHAKMLHAIVANQPADC